MAQKQFFGCFKKIAILVLSGNGFKLFLKSLAICFFLVVIKYEQKKQGEPISLEQTCFSMHKNQLGQSESLIFVIS